MKLTQKITDNIHFLVGASRSTFDYDQLDNLAHFRTVTDGDGMHIFTDPADGETYMSAYIGMDVAQRVFDAVRSGAAWVASDIWREPLNREKQQS